jgi:hypothetical protein
MKKEFKIQEIISAINVISKKDEKKSKFIVKEKNSNLKSDSAAPINQVKPNESEILVLDQMIE